MSDCGMKARVRTGNTVPGWPAPSAPALAYSTGMILWEPTSGHDKTAPIPIKADEVMMLDAYDLPDGAEIFTNRVIVGSYGPDRLIDNCCLGQWVADRKAPPVLRSKRMVFGNAADWVITPENNLLMITIPGVYQFELAEGVMTGEFHVEYHVWKKELSPWFPAVFQGGAM